MVFIFYFIYCLFVLVLKEISKLKKGVAKKMMKQYYCVSVFMKW